MLAWVFIVFPAVSAAGSTAADVVGDRTVDVDVDVTNEHTGAFEINHHKAYSCMSKPASGFRFCNSSLGFDARVADLIGRMTTTEKYSLMASHGSDICAFVDGGIERLGVVPYTWCTETNTGVSTRCLADGRCSTTFPSPAALAASFNRSLWRAKGVVQSDELRASFNLGATRGNSMHSKIGLNGWGPNINLVRDPRYGRNSELPSEDPTLNGAYSVEVVRGTQESGDPRWPLKTHATLKHYTAYSIETNRFGVSENVSTYDLFDSFLPQYQAGFQQGKAAGVMCSYMSMNGVPSCANGFILNHMIRGVWGRPDALVVTDCEAVSSMSQHNHYAKDAADATATSLNAGVDLNTGYPWYQQNGLRDAMGNGTIAMDAVDIALGRSLLWRFKLGLFDDPTEQAYTKLGIDAINTTGSQLLVQDAAAQGLVLLKNGAPTPSAPHPAAAEAASTGAVLPFSPGIKLAVVGPHANSSWQLLSDYYGDEVCFGPHEMGPHDDAKTNTDCIVTVAASLTAANRGGATRVSPGVGTVGLAPGGAAAAAAALAAVGWADAVVLAVGLDRGIEHEGTDRRGGISLPAPQLAFAEQVVASGKPVVLLVINGGVVALDTLVPKAAAVVEAFYPNQAGAAAIGPALFGATNRWGKLPLTIYPAGYASQVTIQQMEMRANPDTKYPGRGYRYYTGRPLFRFGDGMSYTSFETACTGTETGVNVSAASINCTVTNTGDRAGDEVVILYHRPPAAGPGESQRPIRRMLDFGRVAVPAGGKATLNFTVEAPTALALPVDSPKNTVPRMVVAPGRHTLELHDGEQQFVWDQ